MISCGLTRHHCSNSCGSVALPHRFVQPIAELDLTASLREGNHDAIGTKYLRYAPTSSPGNSHIGYIDGLACFDAIIPRYLKSFDTTRLCCEIRPGLTLSKGERLDFGIGGAADWPWRHLPRLFNLADPRATALTSRRYIIASSASSVNRCSMSGEKQDWLRTYRRLLGGIEPSKSKLPFARDGPHPCAVEARSNAGASKAKLCSFNPSFPMPLRSFLAKMFSRRVQWRKPSGCISPFQQP